MNRKKLIYDDKDCERFRELLLECKTTYKIDIYHYCYMMNHVHLLIWAQELEQVSDFSHCFTRI